MNTPMSPEHRALMVAALDVFEQVTPSRLRQARAGTVNTYCAKVPWHLLAALADELEAQRPGVPDALFAAREKSDG